MTTNRIVAVLGLAALLFAAGCSDTTGPAVDDASTGSIDPGSGTFTLKTLKVSPPFGDPVPLILESTGIEVMDDGLTVALGVTVRNGGDRNVGASLIIWISDFDRDDVSAANPDVTAPGLPGEPPVVGFDYSELLGDDGVLEPGEVSAVKRWEFIDPGLGPFSFAGYAEGGFGPPPAHLGGMCFNDLNRDGEPSADEPPFFRAMVHVVTPSGAEVSLRVDETGRYGTRVREAGLYTLTAFSMSMEPIGYEMTTPNPLYVILTPGPEGFIMSYDDAHFGFVDPFTPPPPSPFVEFSDEPADSLHFGSWSFIDAAVSDNQQLNMHVGYSGCSPDQRFSMYVVNAFMSVTPPQLNLLLVHDEEQDCDAWFERTYTFDLSKVLAESLLVYGPGELTLNLLGFDGEVAGTVQATMGAD